jgi:hypothetical protein
MPQAFEWVVQDVGKLRDFVERRGLDETTDGSAGSDRDDFEILRVSHAWRWKIQGMKHA